MREASAREIDGKTALSFTVLMGWMWGAGVGVATGTGGPGLLPAALIAQGTSGCMGDMGPLWSPQESPVFLLFKLFKLFLLFKRGQRSGV